jgi:acyl-coenzyme A synthetase/AMP-(fatty) acid ligase
MTDARSSQVVGVLTRENCPATSVHDLFTNAASRFAALEFLHVPHGARRAGAMTPVSLSYATAREQVNDLRRLYANAGYGLGHRVAIALDNEPEFFLHFLALNALGSSIVPLNAAMSREEIAYLVMHADASLVITHEGHAAHIRAAVPVQISVHVVAAGNTT